MLEEGSTQITDEIILTVMPDESVRIETIYGDVLSVPLDKLARFVNEARAHLNQPVLADEVLKLRELLSIIATDQAKAACDMAFQRETLTTADRIGAALRAMGKLENNHERR